nr:hypothetical protein BaRGS_013979 [Batillaria attramentaria]
MALDKVNSDPNVLPQYYLDMRSNDSQCMPGLGTKVLYQLLYNKPTKIMVLSGCSSVSTFVAQAANMWNLIVTIEDLEKRVKAAGIDIVVRQSFLTDPTNAVRNLKRQDARIIVGVFYEDMARRVFCQAYKEKLYGKKYVWLIIGWYPDNWYKQIVPDDRHNCTVEQLEEALEGHLTTEAVILHQEPTMTDVGMTAQEFTEKLNDRLNITDPSLITGYPEAPLAYDAVWALAFALNKTANRLAEKGMKLEDFDYYNEEIAQEIYSAMNSTKFLGGKPPPDHTRVIASLRVVSQMLYFAMCALAAIGILAGLLCLVFNYRNRQRSYGSMFSKIWTVHQLTTARKKDRKGVQIWELYTVLGILLLLDITVLTAWQWLDPLKLELETFAKEEPTDTDDDILLLPQLEHCVSDNLSVWLGVLFGYKGILLIFGIFLAYETRSVKLKQVNDSRFVLCVITAPISLIIGNQQDATFAFVSLAIVLCSFLSMGLIFVPKMMELAKHPQRDGQEIRSLTDSLVSREEEERHQRMVCENEQLKKQIAEMEDRVKELNARLQKKMQQRELDADTTIIPSATTTADPVTISATTITDTTTIRRAGAAFQIIVDFINGGMYDAR